MDANQEVNAAEDRFFDSLLRSDSAGLERVLGPDFLLIDVMTGSEIPRDTLIGIVGARRLVLDSLDRLHTRVRRYDRTAVVTGQTRMTGRIGNQAFGVHSRYTHVYVHGADGWRLVTAQGTPIVLATG